MFNHHGGGPKLLQSHAVNATQHIWNWVTTGPSKLCMAFFNNGDSSLCRCGTAFYDILELQMAPATYSPSTICNAWSQGPSLRFSSHMLSFWVHHPQKNCFDLKMRCCDPAPVFREIVVRSPVSPEIPNCILKSLNLLCSISIRSCSCIRYWGLLSRASCTCPWAWTSWYTWIACTFTTGKKSCTGQLAIPPKKKPFI